MVVLEFSTTLFVSLLSSLLGLKLHNPGAVQAVSLVHRPMWSLPSTILALAYYAVRPSCLSLL